MTNRYSFDVNGGYSISPHTKANAACYYRLEGDGVFKCRNPYARSL